ncbi:MAG: ABC transporter ATP-binding protein [Breznakia sp.]
MIRLHNMNVILEKQKILHNISCVFRKHEFISIIGQNGSGKSTLLKTLSGYLPYEGHIYVDNNELKTMERKARAKMVSYLPQNRNIPNMKVSEFIAHGRYPHLSFSRTLQAIDRQKFNEAIKITNVSMLLNRQLASLSGGERQRVYIAMMLVQDANILLLDEVVTFLDIKHQLDVLDLLKQLHQHGKTIIMVAHDLVQAFTYSTNIILLQDGNIILKGTPEDIYKHALIKENFGVVLIQNHQENDLYRFQLGK